jgi:hypothetical protein
MYEQTDPRSTLANQLRQFLFGALRLPPYLPPIFNSYILININWHTLAIQSVGAILLGPEIQ